MQHKSIFLNENPTACYQTKRDAIQRAKKRVIFSLFRLIEQGQRLALELMHQWRLDEIKVPYNYFYTKRLAPNEPQYKHRDRESHLIIFPSNCIVEEVSHQVSRLRSRSRSRSSQI